jgi:hypothetical protein
MESPYFYHNHPSHSMKEQVVHHTLFTPTSLTSHNHYNCIGIKKGNSHNDQLDTDHPYPYQ